MQEFAKILFTLYSMHIHMYIPYSWFFEVLKLREWLIFSFFMILLSQMGLPKAQAPQWVCRIVGLFERLNFTSDQHPRICGIYVP